MDQSKCSIPHLKDLGFTNPMTQHLTGSLIHGDNGEFTSMGYIFIGYLIKLFRSSAISEFPKCC
jgi:hypothetical protein